MLSSIGAPQGIVDGMLREAEAMAKALVGMTDAEVAEALDSTFSQSLIEQGPPPKPQPKPGKKNKPDKSIQLDLPL